MRALLGISVVISLAACDSRATASDPGARAEQKSKEYESCGASMHCVDELRCFDQMCRRTARSTVGDFYAASGAAARTRGELEVAIGAYAAALGHYDAEKLPLPPDVDCAYGATLAIAKAKKEHAELGARVLHRCILAVPVGSALRDHALAQLATLIDAGLDPLLLGASKTGDLYLTKGPSRPASDKLTVSVVATPALAGKAATAVPDKLAEIKPALVACWETYNAASKKDTLTVTLALKVSFYSNPDYEEEGGFSTKIEPATGATPEDACVRAAVEPALKSLKLGEKVDSRLAITIK